MIKKLIIGLILVGNVNLFAENKIDKMFFYKTHVNHVFEKKHKRASLNVVKQLDKLLVTLNGYDEYYKIEAIKQSFIKKYIKRKYYVDQLNDNLSNIMNERRYKSYIRYESDINDKKRLLK